MVIKKTLLTLGIIFLAFFILISGYNASKKPIFDHLSNSISEIVSHLDQDDWQNANHHIKRVQQIWSEEKPKYQLNHTTNQINSFEESLYRLQAFIEEKDKAQGMAELKLLRLYWQRLNSY